MADGACPSGAVVGELLGPPTTARPAPPPPPRPAPTLDFGEYVAARLPSLLRFAHVLSGNPHDAADLVQDALEKVGVRWAAVQRGGNPDAYVRRAIVNARTSRWRRHRRETLVAQVPDTGLHAPERFEDEPLWAALRSLPPRQRAVIVLRYYEGLDEAQIAATLGVSTGTVKSQASRAVASLRQQLGSAVQEGDRP